MGSKVIEVNVKPGEKVVKNQKLLVYEAMKMENDKLADHEGVVKRIIVEPNQIIITNEPLIEFE